MKTTQLHPLRRNARLKTYALGGLLLGAAFSSAALTMGRMRGAVWLGQPLDVSMQVQYEETESLASLCFDAEVFHADTRLDSSKVRVSVGAGAQAQTAQIRVQSTAAVDEPVVTVYLRENCLSKSTRRYVMLADVPSDALTTVAVSTLSAAPVTAAQQAAPDSVASLVQDAPQPQPAPAAPRVAPVQKKPQAAPAAVSKEMPAPTNKPKESKPKESKKSEPPKPVKAAQPVVKPQLKLDPLTSLNERVEQLEEATLAAHAGGGDLDEQRVKKLENSVQTLLALVAKNERGMTELREQLQKAESEKYGNALVYGLLALLLVAVGLLVYLWRRQQDRNASGPAADLWRGGAGEATSPRVQSIVVPSRSSASVAPAMAATAATVAVASQLSEAIKKPVADDSGQLSESDATDLDLDDLISPQSEAAVQQSGSEEAFAGAGSGAREEEQALPELPPAEEAPAPAQEAVVPAPEFPTVDPVHIDVSHLSLAPAGTSMPAAEAAPLLDFDFSDLGKPEQPSDTKKPE